MVRADFARYAPAFQKGKYVGIGWLEENDLRSITSREELRVLYERKYPEAAPMNLAQNVGQIWRFLNDLNIETYVVTPLSDNSKLLVGQINGDYSYVPDPTDSPYPHRKSVQWFSEPITRSMLSVPAQNTLRSSLTIFQISQVEEILKLFKVALPERSKRILMTEEEIKQAILEQILELRFDELEILVKELLAAIGFEDAEHKGRPGDEGIDVTGKLAVYEFAAIDIMVQVKRYKSGRVEHRAIKAFRSSVPERAQAAFVTTSDYTAKAREEAQKEGFKKIGLINGGQLVDILVEHYDSLSEELRRKLNLRKTLFPR
ncbi:MAG: restriction endonuclease [Anaerolineae bacterium]|nr:restriction endonuclease [Anaerolineae bacterium]